MVERMDLESWGNFVGEEARKNFPFWREDGFLDKYLSGKNILDIGYEGYLDDVRPITPAAIGVGLSYPGYDGRTLPFNEGSQDAVFVSHCLEHIDDYRNAIADWFRVLRIGGHLIIAVPHQYLYERSLNLPSNFNLDHRRLYTPASLMREVEEALDPLCFRVRLLQDNDRGFDYSIGPKKHAAGCYEILLVIERIERPKWAAEMVGEPVIRDLPLGTFVPFPRPAEHNPVIAISSTQSPRSIIVFKMDHLGDFVLASPSLASVRRAFPDAQITFVCGEWNAAAARQMQLFDEVISFSLFERNAALNGVTSLEDRFATLRKLLKGRSFDLAVDLRVDPDTRAVLKHINARIRAGFGNPREFEFLDIALPSQSPTTAGRTGIYNYDAAFFHTRIGENFGFELAVPDGCYESGTNIIWGPYRALAPSRHLIRLIMHDDEGGIPPLDYDIVCDGGSRKLAAGRCEEIAATGVWLNVNDPIEDLEIRVWGRGEGSRAFSFRGCTINKEGQLGGPHQSEMMCMLVALVEERMRFTPVEEEVQ
jgi:SAM-dependent methyltransferase